MEVIAYYYSHFNGSFIDLGLMLIGAVAGSVLTKALKTSDDFNKTCQVGIALTCILVGVSGICVDNPIVCTIALLIGPVIGMIANLDDRFARWVDKLGSIIKVHNNSSVFRETFIGFLMLTLIGTLSVNGPIENVLKGNVALMVIKGCLDGLTAFDYALAKDKKAVFMAIPIVFAFDFMMSLLVVFSKTAIIIQNINDISTCGSVLLIVLGFNLMGICNIKTVNLLPTVFAAFVLSIVL